MAKRPVLVPEAVAALGILAVAIVALAIPVMASNGDRDAASRSVAEDTPSTVTPVVNTVTSTTVDHHHGESDIAYDDLPADTKAEVGQVIARWADTYPTAADATNAGWMKSTPSLYGIGAHFIKDINGFSVAEPFDMLNPTILLYDGEGPDAKFAGVSYVVADDVEGFTGDYDFWHAHSSVCIGDGGITLTEDDSEFWFSEAECTASGRRVMPLAADQMIHVWIGEGYTDAPIFAHDNPELYDGYYPKQAG